MHIFGAGVFVLLLFGGVYLGLQMANLDIDDLFLRSEKSITAETDGNKTKSDNAKSDKTAKANLKDVPIKTKPPAKEDGAPGFDIVRIGEDGVTVFAGHAKPNQQVSVLADSVLVGTAKSDATGNWVLVSEKGLPNPDPEFSVAEATQSDIQQTTPNTVAASTPAPAASTASTGAIGKNTAAQVNKRMMASLESLIEDARKSPAAQPAEFTTAAVEPRDTPATASDIPAADTSVAITPANGRSAEAKSVPIPVQFIYREAAFTDQGKEAARLLLEYLKLGKFPRIALSGHADERGTEELNMQLSLDRLKTVRDYLRNGGYNGEITLEPRGESDPFTEVDRRKFSEEELFQLDRRVELRIGG